MFEEDILIVTVCVDIVRVFWILLVRHTDSGIDKGYIVLLVLVKPIDKGPVLSFAEFSVSGGDEGETLTGNSLPQ
jgi:hypothetical protein